MAEFTLLKLQVEDASFTAHAPFSGGGGESGGDGADGDETSGIESDADGDSTSRSLLPLVAGLAFLVIAALVVKKLRGGDEEAG